MKELKVLLGVILSLLIYCALIYFAFAFVKADFNPFNWEEFTRFLMILFIVAMFPLIYSIIIATNKTNKDL
jgi:uncharacterized protein (DUF983 family)